jgi:hypothetical protein
MEVLGVRWSKLRATGHAQAFSHGETTAGQRYENGKRDL